MKFEHALLVIVVLVLVRLYQIGAAPTAAPVAQASTVVQAGWRQQFAYDVLTRLGNTAPSTGTVAMIVEWTLAEDAGDDAAARNNPLNTTQAGFNTMHSINEDGVKGYATYADGLDATIQTLSYGDYTGIVAALQANDPDAARAALWASPWASSHYNYGAAWPRIAE